MTTMLRWRCPATTAYICVRSNRESRRLSHAAPTLHAIRKSFMRLNSGSDKRDRKSIADWLDLGRAADTRTLALLAFLFGAAVTLMYRPFSQPEVGDPSIYDYIAQCILRGQLSYRDVVDIKWPGSTYLSALAMLVAKPFGLRDILAVRLLQVLMVGVLTAITFLVANAYLRSRVAGVAAAVMPLMLPSFGNWMASGTEPKLPLMMFGLLTLLFIIKDRPFLAGVSSMLSCLCWQPGLMFTGVAFLIFSRYLTNWRDLRALKVLLGAAIPFSVMALYFYSRGAFGDLWSLTISYNYEVFGPEAKRGVSESLGHLWRVASRIFQDDIVLVLLGLAGYAIFFFERVRAKFKGKEVFASPDTFRDALLFPPAVYFIFTLINFQAGPDLLPFIPFVGIFAAYLFVAAGRWLNSLKRDEKLRSNLRWDAGIPALAASAMLLLALFRGATYTPTKGTIRDQDKVFSLVADVMGPNDKLYVHGTTELLVLLNKPNLNPYIDLDWGKDDYVAGRKYNGSFKALLDEMEAQAPKIVALSRLKVVAHRVELEQWVAAHYDKLNVPGYDGIYIRKPQ